MPKTIKLNKEQKKAVNTEKGNLLIIASAGTGKTTTIVERYINLVSKYKYKPDEVLMTTFTNKAAKDMIGKIASRTKKLPKYIGTMHSLFLRMLRDNSDEVLPSKNFTIIDDPDKKKIVKLILAGMGIDGKADSVKYILRNISKFKNRGISSDYLESGTSTTEEKEIKELADDEILLISPKLKEAVPQIYKKYDSYLRRHNMIDLDDILLLTLRLFNKSTDVKDKFREQFKAIMIDEAQDLNFVQMQILNLLQSNNLCLIGDDCQNIYEWRGSSNDLVFKFNKHYNTITLKDNYRSTRNIISAVNKTIQTMRFKINKELKCTRESGAKINIESVYSFDDEIGLITQKVRNLIKKRIKKEDIAVLFRTNNIGKKLEREFLKNKIPCHLSKSKNFFEREEIKDILSFLKLKVNTSSIVDFERVTLLLSGFGKSKLKKLEELSDKHKCTIIESLEHIDEINFSNKLKEELSILKCLFKERRDPINQFLSFFKYEDYISKKYKDDNKKMEDKLENIKVLSNLLQNYSYDANGIRQFLDELLDIEKKEKDKNKVTLSTIHSAKGLEWRHVFLACCNDGILPFHNGNLGNITRDAELRLFYVAISRAKDFLTVTHSEFNGWKEIYPSEFLDIIKIEDF
ncbi:ATP-dependent helicase [Candidatus Woesearchaeota archaeon]|nr:ATP-dependent helicase [Candidatus Woesearchaeota archaeon]